MEIRIAQIQLRTTCQLRCSVRIPGSPAATSPSGIFILSIGEQSAGSVVRPSSPGGRGVGRSPRLVFCQMRLVPGDSVFPGPKQTREWCSPGQKFPWGSAFAWTVRRSRSYRREVTADRKRCVLNEIEADPAVGDGHLWELSAALSKPVSLASPLSAGTRNAISPRTMRGKAHRAARPPNRKSARCERCGNGGPEASRSSRRSNQRSLCRSASISPQCCAFLSMIISLPPGRRTRHISSIARGTSTACSSDSVAYIAVK